MRLYFLILDNESGEVIVDWFHIPCFEQASIVVTLFHGFRHCFCFRSVGGQVHLLYVLVFIFNSASEDKSDGGCLAINVCGRVIEVLFVVFLCSVFRSPFIPLFCFIILVYYYISFSVMFRKLGTLMRTEHIFVSWSCIRIKVEVSRELN